MCGEDTNWLFISIITVAQTPSVINSHGVKQHAALSVKALEGLAMSYIDFPKGKFMIAQWKMKHFHHNSVKQQWEKCQVTNVY